MKITLIVFSKGMEKEADVYGKILGPSFAVKSVDFSNILKEYDFYLIIGYHQDMANIISSNIKILEGKHVGIVENIKQNNMHHHKAFIGLATDIYLYQNSFKIDECVENALKVKEVISKLYLYAPKDIFLSELHNFLNEHNTCTLITSRGSGNRGTPIEYIYEKGCFYFISEGGEKFASLYLNTKVSLAIYDEYVKMTALHGLQVNGIAEILGENNEKVNHVLAKKNLTRESIKKLGFNMNVIKIKPIRYEFLNTNFKKLGFSIKQVLDL